MNKIHSNQFLITFPLYFPTYLINRDNSIKNFRRDQHEIVQFRDVFPCPKFDIVC